MLKRAFAVMISVLLCAVLLGPVALADEFDIDRDVELSIELKLDTETIPGAGITIYRIGEARNENGQLVFYPIPELAGIVYNLNGLESDENLSLTDTIVRTGALADLVSYSGVTNESGIAAFSVKPGAYLVMQTSSVDGFINFVSHILVLPIMLPDGTGWNYDIIATPKMERETPPTTPPTTTPPTIPPTPPTTTPNETYIDNENEPLTDIGEDDVPLTDVQLDEDELVWIEEEIPLGNIPQTGQLRWPIPILFSAGALSIIFGIKLTRGRKRTDA